MKWLFRPSMLVLLSVVLALGAAAVVLWPRSPEIRAAPLRDDEHEVVWLYSATGASSWERFVSAVTRSAKRLNDDYPDLEVRIDPEATFPPQTTAHPELSLAVRRGKARLVFRWYKLTSDQTAGRWAEALLDGSRRPPVAIIGGNSSDAARDVANSLRAQVEKRGLPSAPLLLLTTATADRVPEPGGGEVPLNDLYPGRTFRFCFTNRQMADAVTEFVWSNDALRPDADPIYAALWEDDTYSKDLTGRFCEAMARPRLLRLAAHQWAGVAAARAAAGFPADLAAFAGDRVEDPYTERIDYNVGGFDQPNRWEAPAAKRLMEEKVLAHPGQRRPLLVLAAPSWQPARRFLRGLARTAPAEARRFVVVTGDALSFNALYRDRTSLWPVQDLPFELVAFCHRNPVSAAAGFLREGDQPAGAAAPATGTEDLLLYMDIVEALVQAANQGGAVPADGDALGERLRQARWHGGRVAFGDDGPPLFDDGGNRRGATGEHIVWLRPVTEGRRVQPQATIEVWGWQAEGEAGRHWRLVRRLDVDYDDLPGER